MKTLSYRQLSCLSHCREYTDKESPLHESGDVSTAGMVARGNTILSLERRGLVEHGGFCVEVDGDGFSVTGNDDAPWYQITLAGREALKANNGRFGVAWGES